MLKRVKLDTEELEIGLYTSSGSRLKDPRNYCVPILDVILIPACETHAIIVMPLLYEHVHLPFRRVGELLEMGMQLSKVSPQLAKKVSILTEMRQCLEFLHEHCIAHRYEFAVDGILKADPRPPDRDFCYYNIMIDPSRLIPHGFHPFGPLVPPDGRRDMYERFKWNSRWSVRPNRYFVIDFGMSEHYNRRDGIRVLGHLGQDRSVPEMSDTVPYDPFPMDIYQFGNMLARIYKVW